MRTWKLTMLSLPELQSAFAAILLDPARGRAPRGIGVYRNNVYGNWSKAMAAAFPIVREIVGADFFDGLAHEYARAHPSLSGDLNEYGARMPEFLAGLRHTQDLPYLPDVARMDWLAHRAYYAADAAPLDLAALTRVPADEYQSLRPRLAPSCALLASQWPLARLWQIHQDEYQGDFTVDLQPGMARILVHRPQWRAEVTGLTLGEYAFLDAALAGSALGAAAEAALLAEGTFDLAGALSRWARAGVLTRLDPP